MREEFGDLSHWKPSREMELAQMGPADSGGQHQSSDVGNNTLQAMGKTSKKLPEITQFPSKNASRPPKAPGNAVTG